jgi:N-acetylglucosaminyl-diphospho-decaprenol L-rhamnosyltransferase
MPAVTPDISIIIVNWNTRELLRECLRSIGRDQGSGVRSSQGTAAPSLTTDSWPLTPEIIVIDNASADGSAEMVEREFPTVWLIVNESNLGFARANNRGIAASRGRYVLLLNSDTVATPDALEMLVAFMDAHPEAGVVGPRLLRPDGTAQPYAFGGDPTLGYLLRRGFNRLLRRRYLHDWGTNAVQEVDWVSGACLMARRAAIEQAGSLDEAMFMYFEDNEWCLRIRDAGWKVYYDPQAAIVHLGGQSLAKNPAARQAYSESLRYFYRKHYSRATQMLLALLLPLYRRVTGP